MNKTNPDDLERWSNNDMLKFAKGKIDQAKRQIAEQIFKDLDNCLEIQMGGIPVGRFGKAFRVHYFHIKQKYLQNPQTKETLKGVASGSRQEAVGSSPDRRIRKESADNQERDSTSMLDGKESRPDVCECGHDKDDHVSIDNEDDCWECICDSFKPKQKAQELNK